MDHVTTADRAPGKVVLRERRRQHFAELLDDLARDVPHLTWLTAASTFLRSEPDRAQALAQILSLRGKPGDHLVITVNGRNPLREDGWRPWWRQRRQSFQPDQEGPTAIDLLTGQTTSPVKTLPKLKGLAGVGGVPTGRRRC